MTHGFVFEKERGRVTELLMPNTNKLSYILVDSQRTGLVTGYDSKDSKIRLFRNSSSDSALINESLSCAARYILDHKILYSRNEKKVYFLYAYISKTTSKLYISGYIGIHGPNSKDTYSYSRSLMFNSEVKDRYINTNGNYDGATICDIDPNDSKSCGRFFFYNDRPYITLYNNGKIYLFGLNKDNGSIEIVRNYSLKELDPTESLTNSFFYVYFPEPKTSNNRTTSRCRAEYQITTNNVPVFITKDTTTTTTSKSILYFIDFDNLTIVSTKDSSVSGKTRFYPTSKYIFNKLYSYIYKILLSSMEDAELTMRIYTTDNNTGKDVCEKYIIQPHSLNSKLFIPDTELVLNAGTSKSNVYIKSSSSTGHYPNKSKIFIRDTDIDSLQAKTIVEGETINLNSVDNKKAYAEADYNDEYGLVTENEYVKTEFVKTLLKNSEQIENVDQWSDNLNDINKKAENRVRTNLFIQEFSKDKIATTIGAVKDLNNIDGRNTYVVTTKNFDPKNNVAIEIDGENNNSVKTSSSAQTFVSGQADNALLPINKFRNLILPYSDILYKRYGIYNMESGDYNILYSLYLDTIKFSKPVEYSSKETDKRITNTNEFINDLLLFMKKYNYNKFDVRILSDFFGSKGDEFLFTQDKSTNTIFKYKNEYGAYKLNNKEGGES